MTVGGVPVITTDAAAEGSGDGKFARGGWWCGRMSWSLEFVGEHKMEHINAMELRTAIWAVKTVAKAVENDGRVLVRIDNMTAKSIINKGASSSSHLNTLAAELMDWSWENGIEVFAR